MAYGIWFITIITGDLMVQCDFNGQWESSMIHTHTQNEQLIIDLESIVGNQFSDDFIYKVDAIYKV